MPQLIAHVDNLLAASRILNRAKGKKQLYVLDFNDPELDALGESHS